MKTERMEVVKTDNGWKRTKYGNLTNFENLVAGFGAKNLREIMKNEKANAVLLGFNYYDFGFTSTRISRKSSG